MPTNEKEINCQLFDQLSILERIEAVTDDEKALKQIAIENGKSCESFIRSPLKQNNGYTGKITCYT